MYHKAPHLRGFLIYNMPMSTIDELKQARIDKLEAVRRAGIDPYPGSIKREQTITEARQMEGRDVAIAGRVIRKRTHGKLHFLDVRDGTGEIQIVVKADEVSESVYKILDLVDLGDFLAAQGLVGKTQAGELSIFITDLQLVSKALRPLPSEWHGFKDIEERYRQRYVDLIINPGVKEIFITRTRVVRYLREFLDLHGFLEVETPVLQPIYGGASAKPFVTQHNTLDEQMYLRIAVELYLKRLIVGGFDKVYEIGKDFRNEGIDRQHNPEFTMLEYYWAYADYEQLMVFTELMISKLVAEIKNSQKITYQGETLDFTPPWPRRSYRDVVLEYAGIDINLANSEKELLEQISQKRINLDLTGVVGYGAILDTLYKTTARSHLVGPMFLTNRPTAFVTLAKRLPGDPDKTSSFQLLIAGKEVINAYNELNDPVDQALRWRESEALADKGQDEHEAFDHDYIRALEYGMPPTAGWGMGIDRLVSILTDQPNIKDVILFPTLRKEVFEVGTKETISVKEKLGVATNSSGNQLARAQAIDLLHTHMQNTNLRRHCLAVGYAMRSLAEKLGGNPDVWEVLGILHDADWEETKDDPTQHTRKTLEWLRDLDITDGPIVHALMSHNRKHTKLAQMDGLMEWALETVDELTGFIVATVLVQPEKKLATVSVDSVMRKWGKNEFARAVDRTQIEQCEEKLGIPLPEFIGLTLTAMQTHLDELGL